MSERPRLYLIDGFSNVFRAFYAIRHLSNSKGEPTNAVFGFFQMLRKLLRDESPAYLGVAFDVGRDTVRSERFEDYKAHRAPMPDDLRSQVPWIRQLLEAYRIPILEQPKYEADDVLGTLAGKAAAAGFEVILVSPDKDLMQLVGENVTMHHTGRDKRYGPAEVEEDFGVPPHQVIDVLALMGDTSDNVPGVPGIGQKGAVKLVREYGSMEKLLEQAADIKRKSYREGLQQHREQAELSKELVTIHTDLPIEFDPEALELETPDLQALLDLCRQLEFHRIVKELEEEYGAATAEPVVSAEEAETAEDVTARLADLGGAEVVVGRVGDDETTTGLTVIDASGTARFCDFRRPGVEAAILGLLADWVGDPATVLTGHDLKEVLRLLPAEAAVRCRLFDTMLGSYLLNPELRGHGLAEVALDRLYHQATAAKQAGWQKGEAPPCGEPALLAFAAEQAELPRRMVADMRQALEDTSLQEVYDTLEEPLVEVLLRMEETGILLDTAFLSEMSAQLAEELGGLEADIYTEAGEEFNLNSPQQLGVILFEKLGYPVLRRTRKTKSYATDAETLEGLAARGFALPELLLRYRELIKLKSTYVDALPALVGDDGRLHTRFNQAVAATGRLSSAHPNLQNIPVRSELGQRIRRAFRAAPGHRLVVADYNQVELRVLAHIAGERAMIDTFQAGGDFHAATAAAVFDLDPALVNPDQRRAAKTINFGIIYGISAFGLARQLGVARKEAERFIAAYLDRFPKVRAYMEETAAAARETGQVATLYGRVRHLPEIRSRNWSRRENAKRMAINARIQGTAADLLKLAMIAVHRRLTAEYPATRLLLTVHDELVLEVPEAEVEAVTQVVTGEMTGVAELAVPLVVDAASGETWYEAKA